MELTHTQSIQYSIRAALAHGGAVNVKVTAAAVYDPNTGAVCSVPIPVPEAATEQIRAALEAALAACEAEVPMRITAAIGFHRHLGTSLGEIDQAAPTASVGSSGAVKGATP